MFWPLDIVHRFVANIVDKEELHEAKERVVDEKGNSEMERKE